MAAYKDIQEGVAEAYDELREEFFPGVDLYLLKVSDTTNEFEEVAIVQGSWFFFDDKLQLQIADDDEFLAADIAASDYIKLWSSNREDIYKKGDVLLEPKGVNPYWSIQYQKYFKKNIAKSVY